MRGRGEIRIESLRFGARDGYPFDPQDIPRTEAQLFDCWAKSNGLVPIDGSAGQVYGINLFPWSETLRVALHIRLDEQIALAQAEIRLAKFDAERAFAKLRAELLASNELIDHHRDRLRE